MSAPLVLVAVIGSTCGTPPPESPSAVIEADPTSVCLGDDYHTRIHLDGAASSAALALVPVPVEPEAPPLRFAWSFAGSAVRVVEGSDTAEQLTVTMAGDRPLHVALTVTNALGGEATGRRSISVTPRHLFACAPEGACPAGFACRDDPGDPVCLPEAACQADLDCPPCFACDADTSRCQPAEVSP